MIKGRSGGDFNARVEHELCVAVGYGVWVEKGCCLLHCSVPATKATKATKAAKSFETSATVRLKLHSKIPQISRLD